MIKKSLGLVSLRGFTLVELLVVIAVFGAVITALLVLVNPVDQIKKANDAKRKHELGEFKIALELYFSDNGSYPLSDPQAYRIIGYSWGNSWPPYMEKLPVDPVNNNKYVYHTSDGQSYYLYANLERGGKDPQACNGGNACSGLSANGLPSAACGGVCNYGVTSPNVSP